MQNLTKNYYEQLLKEKRQLAYNGSSHPHAQHLIDEGFLKLF